MSFAFLGYMQSCNLKETVLKHLFVWFSASFAYNVLCFVWHHLTKIYKGNTIHSALFNSVRPSRKYYWDWAFLVSTPSKQKKNKKHRLRIQKTVFESMLYHLVIQWPVGSNLIWLFFFLNNCSYILREKSIPLTGRWFVIHVSDKGLLFGLYKEFL